MPILMTIFRALFWVALPVIGAACAGVYCSERTRHDLAQEIAQKTAQELSPEAKQLVAPGVHVQDG